jgi:hypothetical protein
VQSGRRKTEALIDAGSPARCILDQASSLDDPIVMGTHGLGGFERFMLGLSLKRRLQGGLSCPDRPTIGCVLRNVPDTHLLCP